jgi:single-stranded-DNA-specific exonuclease
MMHWKLRPSALPPPEPELLAQYAARLEVSERIVRLLWRRGLQERADMQRFLDSGLRHLAPPEHWPGIRHGAEVLAQGLAQGLPMAVWGDYDVDGVTATALVTDFLGRRGHAVLPYLPNRMDEGYGLNLEGVEELGRKGIRLLLTVDCGISDHAAIERARELGMTVVVSDHHLPGDTLPPAQAVCNPRVPGCCAQGPVGCELEDLAGVGVAFFLMAALNSLLPGQPADIRPLLDLVALGTIADVVPLRGQNRILVKNGLHFLNEAQRPGIAALKEVSGLNAKAALGAGQVAFGLAPRINAAGRLDSATLALRLLLGESREQALPLAQQLNEFNLERRKEEEQILEQALEQAQEHSSRLGLILCSPHWHPGVIGIVASRVVERLYRPVILLCQDGTSGLLKGSGRSIPEFDLHAGLTRCQDLLARFGGHRQAAGLALEPGCLDALRQRFHDVTAQELGPEPLTPSQLVDAELNFGEIDFTLLKELELLQPFGMGNPEPVFISPPVQVSRHRVFGGKDGQPGRHVSLQLHDTLAGVSLRAKAWRMAESLGPELVGQRVRVAFTPKIDRYNGLANIDLNIKGLSVE